MLCIFLQTLHITCQSIGYFMWNHFRLSWQSCKSHLFWSIIKFCLKIFQNIINCALLPATLLFSVTFSGTAGFCPLFFYAITFYSIGKLLSFWSGHHSAIPFLHSVFWTFEISVFQHPNFFNFSYSMKRSQSTEIVESCYFLPSNL